MANNVVARREYSEGRVQYMIVRIRFGRGRLVTRRRGKNSRAARLAGSMLTLVAMCVAILGLWRLCEDLGFAGDFVYSDGLLSHWQVWMAAAGAAQYGSWRLVRYAETADEDAADDEAEDAEAAARVKKATVRV